jgi:hypothetical protein
MFYKNKFSILLATATAAVALYCYNPFALYFQNDDFIHIPLSAQGVLLQHNTFRPVCDISIMIDYWLWGKNAWGYHFTNLLLHITVCVVLFYFVKLILKKYFSLRQTNSICRLTITLFFIYSMHSEAVFWILGRSAVLATIFSLLSLYCYLRKHESGKFVAGYILFFIISLLTYESNWVLPVYCFVIAISEIKIKEISAGKELLHLAAIILIFIVYFIVRWHYIKEITSVYESEAFLKGDYITLLKNYTLLFLRNLLPPFIYNKILLACFIIFIVIILAIFFTLTRKNRKPIAVIFSCLLISTLPYCSLGTDTHGTEGERFLYFPSLITCILISAIIGLASLKTAFRQAVIFFLFCFHIIALFISMGSYRFACNLTLLIKDELEKMPNREIVYAVDLPQAQNGALIFRTGFPEMVKWMLGDKFDTAIVCSQRSELEPLRNPYKLLYPIDTAFNCSYSKVELTSKVMVLRFTDTSLQILK